MNLITLFTLQTPEPQWLYCLFYVWPQWLNTSKSKDKHAEGSISQSADLRDDVCIVYCQAHGKHLLYTQTHSGQLRRVTTKLLNSRKIPYTFNN